MVQTTCRYGAVMLIVLLLIAGVRTGMFFEVDIYLIGTGFGVLLLLMAGVRLFGTRRRVAAVQRVMMPDTLLFDRGLPVILGCICGILLLYGFHGIRGPLSLEGTMKEIVLWGGYGAFAAAAWSVCRTAEGLKAMRMGWHLLGAILCGSALLAVYGLLELPYGIHYTADAAISATGARLGGLLQYPNTFGAVMAAFLLERLFALPSVPWTRTSTLRAAAALLPLLPYTAALLLTESRGAWLAAALACAAGFAKERRAFAPLLVAAAAPLASAALLYRQLAAAQLAPAVLPGLLWLAGLWAGGVLAGLLLCRWRHSAGPRRRYAASGASVAAALLVAAAGVLILLQVQDRALGGAATLSARRLMYSDAWQLARSSLWLGRGGETWRQSYLAIQSQPYVGAEVHSGYIDILLDTGFIGLGLVLILLIFVLTKLMQANPRAMPTAIVLIAHAAVDFDWSFGLVWLLLLWIAAIGLAEGISGQEPWHGHTAAQRRWQFKLAVPLLAVVREGKQAHPAWRLLSLTAILMLLGWTVLAASLGISEVNRRAAASASDGGQIALLQSALKWNPANTSAAMSLSDRLQPNQRIPLLKRSMVYAPEHPGLSWRLAEAYSLRGESKAAAAWYDRSLTLDRFNAVKQTRAVLKLASLADWHHTAGEQAESIQAARSALAILQRYRSLAGGLHDITHLRNDREFYLTMLANRQAKRLENRLGLGHKRLSSPGQRL